MLVPQPVFIYLADGITETSCSESFGLVQQSTLPQPSYPQLSNFVPLVCMVGILL